MKLNRKNILILAFTAFVFIAFSFQNCSQQGPTESMTTLNSSCPRAGKSSGKITNQKVFLNSNQLSKEGNSGITLVVDPFCFQVLDEAPKFFGQTINLYANENNDQKMAVQVDRPTGATNLEIETWLEDQPCFLGLFEDHEVKQGAFDSDLDAFDDPEVINQRHLSFVEFYESLEFQNQLSESVVVAVIDTGVDYTHTDLQPSMWRGPEGEYGYNFVDRSDDPMDDDGHGTHIAGLIAAQQNNSFGVIGTANDLVKVMAVKALNFRGSGKSSDIYNGIQYAVQKGADVISLSIYSEGFNTMLESAIIDAVKAGVVVVVAIGNQSIELTSENVVAPAYIGSILNGAISVASVDTSTGAISFFSNFGVTFAEIGAPGAEMGGSADGGLLSTTPGQSWGRMRGTSQAAPFVASVAALIISHLRSQNIAYTPAIIEKIIKTYSSHNIAGLQKQVSEGRVVSFGKMAQNLMSTQVLEEIKSQSFDEGLCSQ